MRQRICSVHEEWRGRPGMCEGRLQLETCEDEPGGTDAEGEGGAGWEDAVAEVA